MQSLEIEPPIRVLVVDDVRGVVDTVIGNLQGHGNVQCSGFDSASRHWSISNQASLIASSRT